MLEPEGCVYWTCFPGPFLERSPGSHLVCLESMAAVLAQTCVQPGPLPPWPRRPAPARAAADPAHQGVCASPGSTWLGPGGTAASAARGADVLAGETGNSVPWVRGCRAGGAGGLGVPGPWLDGRAWILGKLFSLSEPQETTASAPRGG